MPARFGKYTLLRKLATGGMAELFLAIQRSVAGFEKLIVIKRILPAMNHDAAFISMLLHEARVAATLSHPNIVQIFDVGQVDGTYFIAMEHVHGEDLRTLVRQMKAASVLEFPLEHAVAIVLGICAGLAYAHEKHDLDGTALNIVHRDISPQNVVVTFSGDVKVVDFGIAKSTARVGADTHTGKLKGKVAYMSPEQGRGESIDWRSDIFAAGIMLFELTTGKRLFKGPSEYETLKLICERDYPLPSKVRPGYSPELERIVVRALAKDRNARYQSAREMQADLEEFVRHERVPVSTIALSQFMRRLFEDHIASQEELLQQGKQLADIIESQLPPAVEEPPRSSASGLPSAPAAARTVTDVGSSVPPPHARRSFSTLAVIGAFAAILGAAALGYGLLHTRARGSSPVPLAPPMPATRASIEVSSEPPGAAIWVNGDLRSEVTPATIGDLPTGRLLDVKLTKDGFEQAREPITLEPRGPPRKLAIVLKPGSVVLELTIKPEAAAGSAVVTLDGTVQKQLPVERVTPGETHKLTVASAGFVEQTITFAGTAFEKKHFDIALEREMSQRHRIPTLPALPAGVGKLNVSAGGGWCNITVDGVARGPTPIAGMELPAGPHRVVCSPPDGPPQNAQVVVPADGTARYRFDLGS